MKIKTSFNKAIKKLIDDFSEVRPIWGASSIELPFEKRIPKILNSKLKAYGKGFKEILKTNK